MNHLIFNWGVKWSVHTRFIKCFFFQELPQKRATTQVECKARNVYFENPNYLSKLFWVWLTHRSLEWGSWAHGVKTNFLSWSHESMKPCASHVHMATPEAADPSCSIYSNLSNAAVYRQRSSKWISSKHTTLSLIYLLCTWRNTESSECRHLFRRFSAFYNTHENKAEVFFMQAVQYYFFLGRKSLGDKRSAI